MNINITTNFDIKNFYSSKHKCPNIAKLRHLIFEENMNGVEEIINCITDEEIINDSEAQHPFLHELCHQYTHNIELLKIVWLSDVFKKYWNNNDYLDKYGNTPLQRLVNALSNSDTEDEIWIKKNIIIK